VKKLKPLRINGYKKILAGRLVERSPLPLYDTSIYLSTYQVEDKLYYMFETGLQVIGYTDDLERIKRITTKAHLYTFNLFWIMCGRN
jgi:hypothetical protein